MNKLFNGYCRVCKYCVVVFFKNVNGRIGLDWVMVRVSNRFVVFDGFLLIVNMVWFVCNVVSCDRS